MSRSNPIRSEQLAPNAYMQRWQRENLPDRRNYYITDLDIVIRTRAGCVMLVEVKTKNATVAECQYLTYELFDQIFKSQQGQEIEMESSKGHKVKTTIQYFGWHVLELENGTFDGPIKWDGNPVSEDDVKQMLSFNFCCDCISDTPAY